MKTNFRKEMDRMQEDFNIDETTVIEDLDIDTEKIVSSVMNAIHPTAVSSAAGKKRSRLPLILIAAALTVTLIGTTVIAATGIFNPFSQKFAGDTSALKVYENNSFSFSSPDNNLEAKFAGMVGDEEFILAAVELTKKDDSTFTEKDGILSAKTKLSEEGYNYRIDRPEGYDGVSGKDGYHTDSVEYYLSRDKKTLTLYMTVETSGESIKGTRVHFSSRSIYPYKLGEIQDEYYTFKSSMMPDIFNYESNNLSKYQNGKYVVYQIEPAVSSLPYELSFELDNKLDSSMKLALSADNAPDVVRESNEVNMAVSPFKITLDHKRYYTAADVDKILNTYLEDNYFDNETYEKALSPYVDHSGDDLGGGQINTFQSGLLMKDGTEYFFVEIDNGTGFDWTEVNDLDISSHKTLLFSEFPFGPELSQSGAENLHCTVVDPSQIAKIILNKDTVYAAPGCEDMNYTVIASPLLYDRSSDGIRQYFSEMAEDVDLGSLSIFKGNPDPELGCKYNCITVLLSGNEKGILSFINRFERETNNGLILNKVKVYNNSNVRYEVEMEIVNPYVDSVLMNSSGDYKRLLEQIQEKYPSYNWFRIMKDYFELHTLPEQSVPFFVEKESLTDISQEDNTAAASDIPVIEQKPERKEPTIPASEPEKDAPVRPDLSGFRFMSWDKNDLSRLITPETEKLLSPDFMAISTGSGVNDGTRDHYISLRVIATKNEVYNLVNSLAVFEEDNLFVMNVSMEKDTEGSETYDTTIILINPYTKSSNDKIRRESIVRIYGNLDKTKTLEALYRELKDKEIVSLNVEYTEKWIVNTYITLYVKSFEEFLGFKEAVSERKNFSMSEALAIDKVEKHGFKASVFLYSTNYRR